MIAGLVFFSKNFVLVLIHELGHYLAARFVKVEVEEFGLGYPPRALKLFRKAGTLFTLNWIPVGGFVRLAGEDAELKDWQPSTKPLDRHTPGPFYAKKAQWRMLVIVAGATVNLLFGVLAFTLVYTKTGIPVMLKEARIGEVRTESPAAKAQLPTNVNVIEFAVADVKLTQPSVDQLVEAVAAHRGKTATVKVTGACQELACAESVSEHSIYLRTPEETPANEGSMGVSFQPVVYRFYPWYEMPLRASWVGVQQAVWLAFQILESLRQLVVEGVTMGKVPSKLASASDLSGPIGIFFQARDAGVFDGSWETLLNLAGLISINLGIMNLLPIPALDGGRALFILVEQVVGRKRVLQVESYMHYGGYLFLLGLILLITFRDIVRAVYG